MATLCVHAGIAVADTITAHRLELHSTGDNPPPRQPGFVF
jgi:hypothetical protein